MTHTKWIVRLAALVAVTAACSSKSESADEKVTVQGKVAGELNSDNVQAVALGKDGRTFWSPIAADGDFKLTLPVGQAYRVVLVRPVGDGSNSVVAELAVNGAHGKTSWLRGDHAAIVRLGTISPEGAPAPAAPAARTSGLKTAALGIAARGSGRAGTPDHDDDRDDDRDDDHDDDEASGSRGSGHGGTHDDEAEGTFDDWADDEAHDDDGECKEGAPMNDDKGNGAGICKLVTTKTVICQRGAEYAEYTTKTVEIVPCGGGGKAEAEPAPAPSNEPAEDDEEDEDADGEECVNESDCF